MARSTKVLALASAVTAIVSIAAGHAVADVSSTPVIYSGGGTDDPDGQDQLVRTANLLGVSPDQIITVPQTAAFGVGWDNVFVLPLVGSNAGTTYDRSAQQGTAAWVTTLASSDAHSIIAVSHSQGSRSLGDALYIVQRDHLTGDTQIVGVLLADPRFPGTGLETVAPSIIPGIATNGPRQPGDANSNVQIVSVCIATDAVCGFNPYSFSSWFYLPSTLVVHSFDYDNLSDNQVIKTWTNGNTTYVVLAPGSNPYGMLLRMIGIPVGPEFDDMLTKLVPYVTPGERTSIGGAVVPTPREIQEMLYHALGQTVPVTAPDNAPSVPVAQPDGAYSVTVPATVATGAVPASQPVTTSSDGDDAPTPAATIEVPQSTSDDTTGSPAPQPQAVPQPESPVASMPAVSDAPSATATNDVTAGSGSSPSSGPTSESSASHASPSGAGSESSVSAGTSGGSSAVSVPAGSLSDD